MLRKLLFRGVSVLVLMAVMALVFPRAIAAPMLLYPAKGRFAAPPQALSAQRSAELTPEQIAASYKVMPAARYFAAFAVGPEGRFGWVEGRHNAANARAGALLRCGADCEILAEVHPEGYDPDATGMSLSQKAATAFRARNGASAGDEVYYALSPDGTWAAQKPEDGWFLPQLAVLRRCRAFLGDAATAGSACTLFLGPVVTMAK